MTRWDHAPKALQEAIETALGPQGSEIGLRFRPMFGGIMGYAHDRPVISLSKAGLALKLPPETREKLCAQGGAALRYHPDAPPSKTYTLLPENKLSAPAELRALLMQAATYARAQPLRKK